MNSKIRQCQSANYTVSNFELHTVKTDALHLPLSGGVSQLVTIH